VAYAEFNLPPHIAGRNDLDRVFEAASRKLAKSQEAYVAPTDDPDRIKRDCATPHLLRESFFTQMCRLDK